MKPNLRLSAIMLGPALAGAASFAGSFSSKGARPAPALFNTLGDRHPHVEADHSGSYVFRNAHLVAVVQKSGGGFGPVVFYPASLAGEVPSLPAAVAPLIAQVTTREGEAPAAFTPSSARVAGDDRLQLRGAVSRGGTSWDAEADLSIGSEPWLSWEVRVRPAAPSSLSRFTAMPLRAGRDGPREALFPGVAYLEWDDTGRLADPPEVSGPIMPHPYQVTIPLMALWQDRVTVAQMWENRPGEEAGFPAPTFDATAEGGELELARMDLSLPSGAGRHGGASTGTLSVPAHHDVRLAGKIAVIRDSRSPAAAIRRWVDAYGEPIIRGFPRSFEAERRLSRRALSAGPDDPLGGLLRLIDAALGDGKGAAAPAEVASGLRSRASADPMLGYRLGNVVESVRSLQPRVDSIMREQLASGAWPEEGTNPSAAPSESIYSDTVGRLAARALPLLQFGALTGDTEATGAGIRALDYIERTFRVARGTGAERDLPSLAAAAAAADAFLLGYQVSGDPRYMEDARYWADAGLAFIYFWGDRTAMRHASVPVLAPSRAGVAVQPVGLQFALSLRDISRVRPEGLYDFVSEGILNSAMRQQTAAGAGAGALPERWNVREARAEGGRVSPERLLETMYRLMHLRTDVSHLRLRAGPDRHFIASGATLLQGDTSAMRVHLKMRWLKGQDTYTTLTDVPTRPLSVEYNTYWLRGKGIPVPRSFVRESDELPAGSWWYDPSAQLLTLRLRHTGGDDHVEVRWPDPRRRTPIERADVKPRRNRS